MTKRQLKWTAFGMLGMPLLAIPLFTVTERVSVPIFLTMLGMAIECIAIGALAESGIEDRIRSGQGSGG